MDAVEDIKQRLAIEDVISEYVQLKRSGRNLKGISPFTSEKTPSFMVSPEKQIWHDFSSGKGGNMFSFVMEMEGLDFKGALELLARKAGIDLSQYGQRSPDSSRQKERLYQALEDAAKFYQVQFSHHQTALKYILHDREFSKKTALEFRIGYSPTNGTALLDYLTKKGFRQEELKRAGIVTHRYRGWSDMFLGRIMIPLMDQTGRVIGFTARLLEDRDDAPKYINTPQSPLYDKSRHIFGLHLAKESIRKSGYAVMVEGNLDVMASHQAGVTNVVATAGTALTEPHLKAISRFAPDVRLAFDQDKAGLSATERTIPLASKTGVNLQIITITDSKDPDELIKKDPKAWQKAIDSPKYALDWLMDKYAADLDLKSATGKKKFSDVMIEVIKNIADSVEQEHYIKAVAKKLDTSPEALQQKFNLSKTPIRKLRLPKVVPAEINKQLLEMQKVEDRLLGLTLFRPTLRELIKPLESDYFTRPESKTMAAFLLNNSDYKGGKTLPPELQKIPDYVKIITLQYEELYQKIETHELEYETSRLRTRLIENYVKLQKFQIAERLRAGDEASQNNLLSQAKKLDNLLLRTTKENAHGR